jgi:hypothetical protein
MSTVERLDRIQDRISIRNEINRLFGRTDDGDEATVKAS